MPLILEKDMHGITDSILTFKSTFRLGMAKVKINQLCTFVREVQISALDPTITLESHKIIVLNAIDFVEKPDVDL